ncbi:MAG: SAF domain-containing protein [Bryobacterales bacterium]|nr:SAF domain-containing protein [Bryobacterales bacterium]
MFDPSHSLEAPKPIPYDTVELRAGRLHKIRLASARQVDPADQMSDVVKCYCRSHDVLTPADAELQRRPTFVFPVSYFKDLEALIGKEVEGRIYSDESRRRVKFYLDLKEHAGFQLEQDDRDLHSPWYDESVLKE